MTHVGVTPLVKV